MPIALATPHHYEPGHGDPGVDYNLVIISGMNMLSTQRTLVLTMQYGNVDASGNWIPSPEPERRIRIQNIPARTQGGTDPEDGLWKEIEVAPADPVFDNLKDGFVIGLGDLNSNGYDVTGAYLYQYLIDNGHYSGVIV